MRAIVDRAYPAFLRNAGKVSQRNTLRHRRSPLLGPMRTSPLASRRRLPIIFQQQLFFNTNYFSTHVEIHLGVLGDHNVSSFLIRKNPTLRIQCLSLSGTLSS